MLVYAKVPFEDVRFPEGSPEWLAIKPKCEFGMVPMLELTDGTRLV